MTSNLEGSQISEESTAVPYGANLFIIVFVIIIVIIIIVVLIIVCECGVCVADNQKELI